MCSARARPKIYFFWLISFRYCLNFALVCSELWDSIVLFLTDKLLKTNELRTASDWVLTGIIFLSLNLAFVNGHHNFQNTISITATNSHDKSSIFSSSWLSFSKTSFTPHAGLWHLVWGLRMRVGRVQDIQAFCCQLVRSVPLGSDADIFNFSFQSSAG